MPKTSGTGDWGERPPPVIAGYSQTKLLSQKYGAETPQCHPFGLVV
jgi:hypothetical protein